ncbi:MAG: hypothetical protein R3C24_01630 [Cyanobacteriota/Melainabacteria group bacterium]
MDTGAIGPVDTSAGINRDVAEYRGSDTTGYSAGAPFYLRHDLARDVNPVARSMTPTRCWRPAIVESDLFMELVADRSIVRVSSRLPGLTRTMSLLVDAVTGYMGPRILPSRPMIAGAEEPGIGLVLIPISPVLPAMTRPPVATVEMWQIVDTDGHGHGHGHMHDPGQQIASADQPSVNPGVSGAPSMEGAGSGTYGNETYGRDIVSDRGYTGDEPTIIGGTPSDSTVGRNSIVSDSGTISGTPGIEPASGTYSPVRLQSRHSL